MDHGRKQTTVSEQDVENSGLSDDRLEAIGDVFGRPITQSLLERVLAVRDAAAAEKLLAGMIEAEKLPIGSELPSKELGLALDLHRNTIARALKTLVARGYLSRRKGFAARIASHHPVLPERKSTTTISYAALAQAAGVEITNDAFGAEPFRIRDLPPADQVAVASNLDLDPDDQVIVYSRIRRIRMGNAFRFPVVAEIAYFAAKRTPNGFLDGLKHQQRVLSLSDYLRENDMEPVNSAYLVRISHLLERFVDDWVMFSGVSRAVVAAMAFLRVECTTFSVPGAIEYSVAYLHPEIFTLSSTTLQLGIHLAAPPVVLTAQGQRSARTSHARPAKAPVAAARTRSLHRS